MAEETVTVGDTEVTIEETEDGFEVEPVEDEPEGLYLRAVCDEGNYGFELPLGGDYELYDRVDDYSSNRYKASWDTENDVSDLNSIGGAGDFKKSGHGGHANVNELEIVEY